MMYYHEPKLVNARILVITYENAEHSPYDRVCDLYDQLQRFDTASMLENYLEVIELEDDQQLWNPEQGFPSEFGQSIIDKLKDFDIAIFDLPDKHYGFAINVSVLLYRTTHKIDCTIFMYHRGQEYFLDSKTTADLYGDFKEWKPDLDDDTEADIFEDEHLQQEYVVEELQQTLL